MTIYLLSTYRGNSYKNCITEFTDKQSLLEYGMQYHGLYDKLYMNAVKPYKATIDDILHALYDCAISGSRGQVYHERISYKDVLYKLRRGSVTYDNNHTRLMQRD